MSEFETRLPELIRQLYDVVNELERLCPGRRFTPDGHLVGSIGEAIAKYRYGVELLPCSYKDHDARTANGRLVQVKATQGARVAFYAEPEHLIVLRLSADGVVEEVYNGPGAPVWAEVAKLGKNGQRTIAISKLRKLMAAVPSSRRLPLSNA